MIWTGAGAHGTALTAFLVAFLAGIDPDQSTTAFFLILAPCLLIVGIALWALSGHLQRRWSVEADRGWGYRLNGVCSFLKCDFGAIPTVFFIPMPFLSLVAVLIALVVWSGVLK
jgi:hypothetical protein